MERVSHTGPDEPIPDDLGRSRLLDQARRFAAEQRAYVRAVQLLLSDWAEHGREGLVRTEKLERARGYLDRAVDLHALEHTARQLAAMGSLSLVDAGRGLGLLGAHCEERSRGFETGLAGGPCNAPHPAGFLRAQAWLEGHAAGAELTRCGVTPEVRSVALAGEGSEP